MPPAISTTTSAVADMNLLWRQVQADGLAEAIQFESEEFSMLDEFAAPEGTPWSARSVKIGLDIAEVGGVASIPEFGYEAQPGSANARELDITLIHLNARFNASKLARWGDKGAANQLKTQLKQQALQKLRAMGATVSDYFYGPSTAVLCQTTTAATATNGVYTLANGYGVSGLGSAAWLANKFKVGDRIALVRAGALVANAIGRITAINAATPSVTVTWNGSVTSASGDNIVKANSLENETLAGTDFNRGFVGLQDITTATTVHGLATSTEPNWSVALNDTSAGRFSYLKLRRGKDELNDQGGAKAQTLILARGVYRDAMALERGILRMTDPLGLSLDGDVKAKGVKIFSSRRVPNGMVYLFDRSFLRKWALLPKPDEGISWDDGKEYIDQSGYVFSMDLPMQLVCRNRKAFAVWSNQTEQ